MNWPDDFCTRSALACDEGQSCEMWRLEGWVRLISSNLADRKYSTSPIDSGSSSSECREDTSTTGVALKTLSIGTSGRLVMRNLSGAKKFPAFAEIACKRADRSSWFRHSSSPSMTMTVGYVTPCRESCCRGLMIRCLNW